MSRYLLFLIGTDLPGLILLFLVFAALIFFICKYFVKRILQLSPDKVNKISIIITSGILIFSVASLLFWSYLNFRNLDLPTGDVFFDQSQPEEKKKLNSIPAILNGEYLSESDSSYLSISENKIVLKTISNFNFSLAELDSVDRLKQKDTIYNDDNGSMFVQIKNDSVYQRLVSFDTLFYVSEKYELKEANGYYFFNRLNGSRWIVGTLRIINDQLLFRSIRSKDEIEAINDHGSAQLDPVPSKDTTKIDDYYVNLERLREEIRFDKIKSKNK